MEAATPLPFSQVRTQGGRLWIDGLVVDDACAVRLAREREVHGEDVSRLVLDAIAIGVRVLDREQTGANADFVKAEFEKAARELDTAFVDRARLVAERLDKRIDEAFGPENGHMTKALARHFGDESSVAVQNRVKALLTEVGVQMREDLRKQFSSDGDNNPLATFQRMAIGAMRDNAQAQSLQLKAMDEKLATLREEVVKLQGEKDKLAEVAAEVDRGTAKGRSYEEEVAAAVDALAMPLGDDCAAVGDVKEATGKVGDVVVTIGASHGPAQGRIVFEAKNSRLSRPEARATARRGASASATPTTRCSSCRPTRRCRRGCTRCASTTATSSSSPMTPRRARWRCRSPMRWRGPGCLWPAATPRTSTAQRWPTPWSARWPSSRRCGASASSSRAPRRRSTGHLRSWAP